MCSVYCQVPKTKGKQTNKRHSGPSVCTGTRRTDPLGTPSSTMAVSQFLMKGSNKGEVADPFPQEDCCDVEAPASFDVRNTGKILVMRTQGTKLTSDGIKSCVFEVS